MAGVPDDVPEADAQEQRQEVGPSADPGGPAAPVLGDDRFEVRPIVLAVVPGSRVLGYDSLLERLNRSLRFARHSLKDVLLGLYDVVDHPLNDLSLIGDSVCLAGLLDVLEVPHE